MKKMARRTSYVKSLGVNGKSCVCGIHGPKESS